MEGTVTWFDKSRGFGFVRPNNPGLPDHFVHISAVQAAGLGALTKGQRIEFESSERQGKTIAVNLRLIQVTEPTEEDILLSDEDMDDQDLSVTSKDLTKQVAEWKLEARSEDNDRYFFHVKEVSSIENGEKCYVI